jgi:replicative DNA helicase
MLVSVDQSVSVALDLEREFLSHLSDRNSLETAIRDGVSTDLFYAPKNKAIYTFAQHYLNETKQAPSPAVLATEFANFDIPEPQASIEWVVTKLRERYQSNQVESLMFALADKVGEPSEAMDYLRATMMEIERNSMSTKHVWAAGDHKLFLSQLQDKIMAGQYQGLPIGFDAVDTFTGGLKPGYLAFLAARPKRQKTFFILNAFIKQKQAGYKPALFTLENTEEEVMLRISCMLSGYPWDLAQRGIIDTKGWKLLEESWEEFDALGDHWISRPPMDERTVSAMLLAADKFESDSVIISQFKYIQPMVQYKRPDHEKYAEIVMDLKGAATRPGSERPILVEAQFNREGESIDEFMDIGLGQLGLTDMIGQAADVVYALYQNKDMRAQGHTQFGIIEARNHDKKNWYVRSEFKNSTYMELVT